MNHPTNKTTATFSRPFTLPDFDETLPAGDYEIETELCPPPDHLNPEAWKASVVISLRPRVSHPGLVRALTVSLADLDSARAKDKLTGLELSQLFLEEMLADPMVRLVMEADGVSELQLRHLYSRSRTQQSDSEVLDDKPLARLPRDGLQDATSIQVAENEGMPTLEGNLLRGDRGIPDGQPPWWEHGHDQ
ncbi:hypothetical protein [Tropicimonas sediminicola]|uniref:Uncharacterized protein n=1 Tax=Tropicimonas sediminicola TaxID=1031541 RepID=A0A239MI99_9RHOB|nr:hypothetical protein [Tropicimonas sediminicola]SNT41852.1 hypothetical protein SAMN05421757_1208 [Tropicimonas sediminicola]